MLKHLLSLCSICLAATLASSCAIGPLAPASRPSAWKTAQPEAPSAATVVAPPDNSGVSATTEYFHGTGQTRSPAPIAGRQTADGKRFDLNMQEADVRAVVDLILGEELKLHYSVSPLVQGKLTLRTGRPVAREALLPILETALLSVSATLIDQDGSYHVLPLDAAPQRVRGARLLDESRRTQPGFAIEVIPLRYTSAREMQKILDSFAPKGSVLQANDVHGHIVIAGSSQERSAMIRTIDSFDVDSMNGMHFAIYRLDQVRPEQLVAELKQVFQPPIELIGTRVRLIPMERIKAVLGIARKAADLELVEEWVRRFDVSTKSGDRRLYVYNVQNGNAKDLATSLQFVLTGQSPANTSTSPSADPGHGGKASAPAPVGNALAPPAAGYAAENQSRVGSNDENNSLLIFCTEQEYRLIREALAQLDVLPRQVMIEAILAEVTLNDNLRYGVQWFFSSGSRSATFSSSQSGSTSPQYPGFSYIYSGLPDARVVIDALQSKTNVKVLSAPKLSVLNNQKASLQVGDQVPVRTQVSQATLTPNAPVVSSIQMVDTGVILEVTPRINENGNVILDVSQEVSDVAATTSSGIDSPTIQKRRLRSVIATRDGATVALGGLIRESATLGNAGVPLLKNIPLVGNLFSSNTDESRRTELIVLIAPRVMRSSGETEAVADSLIENMNAAAELAIRAAPIVPK